MKITIVGAGYVGLVTGVCFALRGMDVKLYDIDNAKVDMINSGKAPIYEKGLEKALAKTVGKHLNATSDAEGAVRWAEIIFICVGTPSLPHGETDLSYVFSAAKIIGKALEKRNERKLIVVKSTVPPGTTERVAEIMRDGDRAAGARAGVAMNPEFLREGTALEDALSPDRIIIGADCGRDASLLARVYAWTACKKIVVSIRTAELIKYSSNAFLAAKVSFANEIAGICEQLGADIDEVMDGVGSDARIGRRFLDAGPGFGGSCFPKDVRSLIFEARRAGAEVEMLSAIMSLNVKQQRRIVCLMKERISLNGKKVAVLGLAFKANTDDVRESPAIPVMQALVEAGSIVRAYDPQAMANMKKLFPAAEYCHSLEECLHGVDAAVLVTDWKQFKKPAKYYKGLLDAAPLFDARRVLPERNARAAGLDYHCIGRGKKI